MAIISIKQPTIATKQRIERLKALARLKRQVVITSERKAALHNTTANKSENV
jgi:hypothetical protein